MKEIKEGILEHVVTAVKNGVEDLSVPNAVQLDGIKSLIGEDAISCIHDMGAGLYVPNNIDRELTDLTQFALRYRKRIVTFYGKIYRDRKYIRIAFMYESDFMQNILQSNLINLMGDVAKYTEKYQKTSKVGQDKTSLPFLRGMYDLVTRIDPACDIQLCPSDEQRKRIYTRVLGNRPNIKIY